MFHVGVYIYFYPISQTGDDRILSNLLLFQHFRFSLELYRSLISSPKLPFGILQLYNEAIEM